LSNFEKLFTKICDYHYFQYIKKTCKKKTKNPHPHLATRSPSGRI